MVRKTLSTHEQSTVGPKKRRMVYKTDLKSEEKETRSVVESDYILEPLRALPGITWEVFVHKVLPKTLSKVTSSTSSTMTRQPVEATSIPSQTTKTSASVVAASSSVCIDEEFSDEESEDEEDVVPSDFEVQDDYTPMICEYHVADNPPGSGPKLLSPHKPPPLKKPSNVERTIMNDLVSYHLPNDIKQRANEIFLKMHLTTKKGKGRSNLLFFCVYNAYKELNVVIDPMRLAYTFEVPRNAICKSLTFYSVFATGYQPPMVNWTAIDLIPSYCSEIENINNECVQSMVTFGQRLFDKEPNLYNSPPQKMAAGVIVFYLGLFGHRFQHQHLKLFSYKIHLTDTVITNVTKQLSSIYNA